MSHSFRRRAAFAAALPLLLIAAVRAADPVPPPAAPAGQPLREQLPALVAHSRHLARLDDGRLSGEGADLLRELTQDAQFVLMGEEHGNSGIADFAAALWSSLRASGFSYAAVEVDPWVADAMNRELRRGGVESWRGFVAGAGGGIAAPFFVWDREAAFAATVVSSTPRDKAPPIWGLDQVFLGSAPWLLARIADRTLDRQARQIARDLIAAQRGHLNGLGLDPAPLLQLRMRLEASRERDLQAIIEAMLASQKIYAPFSGGSGESFVANNEREQLMKRNFLREYRAAARRDGQPPRVMLKFGGYHMYRGATPTGVQGLGGFVTELATANGRSSLAIYVACGPGGATGGLRGENDPCDERLAKDWSFLSGHIDPTQVTIFDLRTWKLRLRRWQHLDADQQRLLFSYDLVVVVPGRPAAQMLPGLAPVPTN